MSVPYGVALVFLAVPFIAAQRQHYNHAVNCPRCHGTERLSNCPFEKCIDRQCAVQQVLTNNRYLYYSGCVADRVCDETRLQRQFHQGHTECSGCCHHYKFQPQCSLDDICPSKQSPTTAPDLSRKCQVCSGQSCKGHVGVTRCGHPSDLCMTSVENKQDGTQKHTKRCATLSECDDKWLKETTLKPECVGFHPDSTYKFNFNCTFCCKTNGCNSQNMPAVESLYLIG